MCFEVILRHFWEPTKHNYFTYFYEFLQMRAIPVFVLLSFYLISYIYIYIYRGSISKRIQRLLVPYLAWTVVYFLLVMIFHPNLGIDSYIYQLLFCTNPYINRTLWYQIDLLILTVLFYSLYKYISLEKINIILWILIILCLFLQYSGLNELVFNSFRYEIRFSIGRLIEIIPFACIGLLLGNKDLNKIKTKRWYVMIISIILFLVTMNIQRFIECDGYGFSGFDYIIYAVLLFLIAYCFGIEKKEKPYWTKYIFIYGISLLPIKKFRQFS